MLIDLGTCNHPLDDDMMDNHSIICVNDGVLIHHIDRDDLSDDEYEYPKNMVDQPSIIHEYNQRYCPSYHHPGDDYKSLMCEGYHSPILLFLLCQYSSNISHVSFTMNTSHKRYHGENMRGYLMNMDEMRGEYW